MKYEDVIVKFKESGAYEVNVHLVHLEKIIKEYKEDYSLDLNPDFQRGYAWNEAQQIAYVEFLLKGGESAKVIYFNCPYFEDYQVDKYDMDMVCVDGLQRLTAIRKFLSNELPVFGYYLKDFEDYRVLLRSYSITLNVNCLKTKKEVLEWYIDFNSGGTVHSEEEISRVKKLLDEEIRNV